MAQIVLITGASSGIGRLTALALADAGHTVYASMRQTQGKNADQVASLAQYAGEQGVALQAIELDVSSEESVAPAVAEIIAAHGRLDVVIHNAGHMVLGPAEAFTPEQVAEIYDVNVVSTQRVNRATLPHLRRQRSGLVVWVSSSSVAGGTPPYLGPYFAAKAAMDALAVSYARELVRWGIETTIIVPGAFTSGTSHFANAGQPGDETRATDYDTGPYPDFAARVERAFAGIVPEDADVATVARAIVTAVDAPAGRRPFRVHVDPTQDGAEVAFGVIDRVRAEMLRRVGFDDLLPLA